MDCFGKSMLQKSKEKRKAKKLLHGNFHAGHVVPNDHYLGRVGIRGRKKWLFYCLLVVLFLLVLGHLVVTCLILAVLRFGVSGFPFFMFRGSSIVWLEGGATLKNVTITAPYGIHSYKNTSLSLSGGQRNEMRSAAINFTVGNSFNVTDNENRQLLFINSSFLGVEETLVSGSAKTSRLTTHTLRGVDRVLSSQGYVTLIGAGGVNIRGSIVNVTTGGGRINLTAQERLILHGNRGIFLEGLYNPPSSPKYHLCARANGTLFLTPLNPQRCRGPM